MKALLRLSLALSLGLGGCAPAVSTSLEQQAGPPAKFAELAAHPEKYQGREVVLGGEVMKVESAGKGSLMAVNQFDLDDSLYPAAAGLVSSVGGKSGGTFLVESDEYLSPATYQPGSRVTVTGVVAGQRRGLLLLKARKVYYWEGPRWEKWYYPVPREWYDYDPNLEKWYTPPYYNPWYPGGRR